MKVVFDKGAGKYVVRMAKAELMAWVRKYIELEMENFPIGYILQLELKEYYVDMTETVQ